MTGVFLQASGLFSQCAQNFQYPVAMFLFLSGKAAEDMSVLWVSHSGFILGKATHFSAVTSAQNDLRRILRNGWRGNQRLFTGDQGVDPFQAGDV